MDFSVLVVDDDPNVRDMIRIALETEGYEVVDTGKVTDAIRLIAERSFDVVVTDLIMPDHDGMQLITELRRRGSQVRIIAISGGGRLESDVYLEIAKRLRVDDVLAKPFDAAKLVEVVQNVVKRRPATQ